jgi:hypothetical protein
MVIIPFSDVGLVDLDMIQVEVFLRVTDEAIFEIRWIAEFVVVIYDVSLDFI